MASSKTNKKKLKDTLNNLSNMKTDVVSTFDILYDLGISISHDGGRMKDIGEVIKELACKLNEMI